MLEAIDGAVVLFGIAILLWYAYGAKGYLVRLDDAIGQAHGEYIQTRAQLIDSLRLLTERVRTQDEALKSLTASLDSITSAHADSDMDATYFERVVAARDAEVAYLRREVHQAQEFIKAQVSLPIQGAVQGQVRRELAGDQPEELQTGARLRTMRPMPPAPPNSGGDE